MGMDEMEWGCDGMGWNGGCDVNWGWDRMGDGIEWGMG